MLQVLFVLIFSIWFVGGIGYCCKIVDDMEEMDCLFTVGNLIFGVIFLPFTLLILIVVCIVFIVFMFKESKIYDRISKFMSKKLF